jgi:hypothetical protein
MRVLQGGIVFLIAFISLLTRRTPQGLTEITVGLATALLAVSYFLSLILEVPGPESGAATVPVSDDTRLPWESLRDLH